MYRSLRTVDIVGIAVVLVQPYTQLDFLECKHENLVKQLNHVASEFGPHIYSVNIISY
jgi:hypothetical protein